MANGQLRFIVRALEKVTERAVAKITLDATANLIETTPVNTGWARANWVPSIGSPIDEPTGDQENVSQSEQDSGIAQVATQYKLDMGKVFITNNVPYIGALNDGHSQQAPSGFVQVAVEKAVTIDILGLGS